jgi:hypothetical protein
VGSGVQSTTRYRKNNGVHKSKIRKTKTSSPRSRQRRNVRQNEDSPWSGISNDYSLVSSAPQAPMTPPGMLHQPYHPYATQLRASPQGYAVDGYDSVKYEHESMPPTPGPSTTQSGHGLMMPQLGPLNHQGVGLAGMIPMTCNDKMQMADSFTMPALSFPMEGVSMPCNGFQEVSGGYDSASPCYLLHGGNLLDDSA